LENGFPKHKDFSMSNDIIEFELVEDEQLTTAEIAERDGLSERTVRNYLKDAGARAIGKRANQGARDSLLFSYLSWKIVFRERQDRMAFEKLSTEGKQNYIVGRLTRNALNGDNEAVNQLNQIDAGLGDVIRAHSTRTELLIADKRKAEMQMLEEVYYHRLIDEQRLPRNQYTRTTAQKLAAQIGAETKAYNESINFYDDRREVLR
jgi:hypothetical protein